MRAAQPTPGVTLTAEVGQFTAQAPHSMQPSRSAMCARRGSPSSRNTPCGQTVPHAPQPMQRSGSRAKVTTPSR